MKRKVLSVIAIAAVVMTSCKKAEPANYLGSATVTGKITADLDLSNDINGAGAYQAGFTPDSKAGINVYAEVNTRFWDQKPDPNYTYLIKTYSTTTAADGSYSFTIPATEKPYSITIKVGEFTHNQVQYAADGNHGTVTKRYTVGDQTVSIFDGGTARRDMHMNAATVGTGSSTEVFGTFAVSGKLFYNNNTSDDTPNTTYNSIPAGYKIQVVYTNNGNIPGGAPSLVKYIDVAADGTYSGTLPTRSLSAGDFSDIVMYFPDIVSTYTYPIGGGNTETINYVWQANSASLSISNGNATILDRTFN
jgi:hypothetical protein